MINTQKVKGRMVEKNLTYQMLSPKINCSAYTLGQKVANETPMNLEEAIALAKELDITEAEFADFFLKQKL